MQQTQQLKQVKLSDEGYEELGKRANSLIFTIPPQGDFSFATALHTCFNCFTPNSLGLPRDWYAEMLLKRKDFTYADMCMIVQVLPQATGRAMNMQPRAYAQYLVATGNIMKAWGETWNALLDELAGLYPVPVQITEVDVDTGEATKVNPANLIPLGQVAEA